jgi:Lipoprotein amino terminal region
LFTLTRRAHDLTQSITDPLKDPNICGLSSCELDNEKFRYAPNVEYKYSYESSFSTLFEGTDNNDPESEMFISAFIDISFPTKCQGQMKMSSVRLKKKYSIGVEEYEKPPPSDYEYEDDSVPKEEDLNEAAPKENVVHPRSQDFSNEIEEMDLRFDFHDGLIQEVCPKSGESVWVTNFKRGILSAFQNTMSRFDLDHRSVEKDVSGKCEVSYRFEGSKNTGIVILKKKDIGSCQNRNKFKSIVQTTPYEFRRVNLFQ